jgi:hypothetical protein
MVVEQAQFEVKHEAGPSSTEVPTELESQVPLPPEAQEGAGGAV